MISKNLSLAQVAALISGALEQAGIEVCVVGGSAVTVHVPHVYTSMDIDFSVLGTADVRRIERVFYSMGYEKKDRVYAHPESAWTLDLVPEPPTIGSRSITSFAMKETASGVVRTLRFEDTLADRVAHFVFWSDSEALDVAERAARAMGDSIDWAYLSAALEQLGADDGPPAQRLDFAVARLRG